MKPSPRTSSMSNRLLLENGFRFWGWDLFCRVWLVNEISILSLYLNIINYSKSMLDFKRSSEKNRKISIRSSFHFFKILAYYNRQDKILRWETWKNYIWCATVKRCLTMVWFAADRTWQKTGKRSGAIAQERWFFSSLHVDFGKNFRYCGINHGQALY